MKMPSFLVPRRKGGKGKERQHQKRGQPKKYLEEFGLPTDSTPRTADQLNTADA